MSASDAPGAAIRVLLADDHPVVRHGLRALIDSIEGLAVVGEAVDGESAVRETQLSRPDVVLMDIQMPGVDGLEATRRIKAAVPATAVLVLTMFDDDNTVFAAMQAGASGYLLKGAEQEEIDRAIRAVVSGEAIFGPGVAARVLGYFSAPPKPAAEPFPELTGREREILDRIAAGHRNATIAAELHLAPKTVGNHISAIFAKLAVADRSAAIVRARQEGLGQGHVIAGPVVATLIPAAVVTGGSGVLLLRARRAVAAGALLVTTAALGALAAGARAMDTSDRGQLILLACALGTLALSVCAYPSWTWSDPVAFAAVVSVGGTGVVGTVSAQTPDELMGFSLFSVLAIFCLLWWRLERTPAGERTSLLWLAVAAGSSILVATTAAFTDETSAAGGAVAVVALAVLGPAMVVGVLRPEIIDVRGLMVHAIVYAVTLLLYVAVFSGIVSGLDLGGRDRPSPGTLGVIGAVLAVGFHPTTVILRGVIDRLLFGDRPDPLRAATQVADRIGDDPVLALRAIREALVLPYASLRADGRELAASGTAVTHTRVIPLALGEASVGEIVVGLRAGDLRLSGSDEHVLRIVAPLLAQTIRARALATDLQASRGEAIAAIEEERRRLRRDLHDGLGPTLTGVAFATDAARNKLRDDPSGADELLGRLRSDTADAITEIRRLVEGLRPPALDDLGLVAAVVQQARHMHAAGGDPLVVSVDAPNPMPDLPAAAEVAAYRIIVEALTNVARHSGSARAHVALAVADGTLAITVSDSGSASSQWRPGVGMSSMRERAELVGGRLSAGAGSDGGRVEAQIPLG